MDVLCNFKFKLESPIWNISKSKTSDYFQIKIKMLNTSQEPPAPTKASNQGLKDMDVPCTLKNQDGAKNQSTGK